MIKDIKNSISALTNVFKSNGTFEKKWNDYYVGPQFEDPDSSGLTM